MRRLLVALVLATGTALAAAGCSPSPTPPAGTSDDDEWTALNSYDGVVTNSFLQLPGSIGEMDRERQDSNPPGLEFHADYVSNIRDAKARVAIYYARTPSGPVPVRSAADPDFTEIVAGNSQAFQGAGTSRAVDAGGLDWSCFEGSQDGLAHTICVTPKYGRVVEVQYLNAGRVDRSALDAFLGGVGNGVAALRR